MQNKFFATSMKESILSNDDSLFTIEDVIMGDYDSETGIFTDESGNQYHKLFDYSGKSENMNFYTNLVSSEEIGYYLPGSESLKDIITAYEKKSRTTAYHMCRRGNRYEFLAINRNNALKEIEEDLEEEERGYASSGEEQGDTLLRASILRRQTLQKISEAIEYGRLSPDELIEIQEELSSGVDELEQLRAYADVQREKTETELMIASHTATPKLLPVPSQKSALPAPVEKKATTQVPNPRPLLAKAPDEIEIDETFKKIKEVLIDQDEAALRTLTEIVRMIEIRKKDYGILLTGESGTGKTLLMTLIGKILGRPFLKIDSTQLTIPGYTGRDLEEYLWDLIVQCNMDIEQAQNAIVYIDEIDKKGSDNKSDVSGQGVINVTLKMLDGETYIACKNPSRRTEANSAKINTENMIFVFGGAFTDVYGALKKQSIGFENTSSAKSKEPKPQDFVKYGMMTGEFMGRVPVIIKLKTLNVDGLRRVLIESRDSALKLEEEIFAANGVKLSTTSDYLEAVATEAIKEGTGARGLNKLILDSTWKSYYDVKQHPGTYSEITLTKETVEDPSSYRYVKVKK